MSGYNPVTKYRTFPGCGTSYRIKGAFRIRVQLKVLSCHLTGYADTSKYSIGTPLSSGRYHETSYSLGLVKFKTSESRRTSPYNTIANYWMRDCFFLIFDNIPNTLHQIGVNFTLTFVSILGASGGPRSGIVICLDAPHRENPTRFLDPNRKS